MNKLMPYFKLMKKNIILVLVIALSIVIVNDGKEILTGFNHSLFENGYLIFKSEIYSSTALLMFIFGVLLSYKQFNISMNIKADRNSYIKASIASIIGLSIAFSIITILFTIALKFIVENVSGKNALVLGDSAYITSTAIDFINNLPGMGTSAIIYGINDVSAKGIIRDILGQFLTLLSLSSIGFLFGSLIYRLKKITSVIIFLIIPASIISLGVAFSLFNTDLFMNYISMNLTNILMIIININVRLILKILSIVISLTGAIILLKKAPIKEYAHDLL